MIRFIFGFLSLLGLQTTLSFAIGNPEKDPFRPVGLQTIVPAIVRSSKLTSDIQMDAVARQARGLTPKLGTLAQSAGLALGQRLARVTAYWAGEDRFSHERKSSTGIRLHAGACAVDPRFIPYGSVVQIAGIGKFLAIDTGTAVISRRAARVAGHNRAECNALVVDLFFEKRADCDRFTSSSPEYASISWFTPSSDRMKTGRLVADEE